MRKLSRVMTRVLAVWGTVFSLLRRHPIIGVPFMVIGFADVLLLAFVFIMTFPPLSKLSHPFVSTFWGGEYFHYPLNVYLLPKVFSYFRNITGLFIGVLLTAVTVMMVHQAVQGNPPSWRPALKKSIKKYSRFAMVWAMALSLAVLAMRMTEEVYALANSHETRGLLGFIAAVVIQILFFFALPAIGVENKKIRAALRRSFALFKCYPFETAILVLLPNTLVIPLIYAYTNMSAVVARSSPEAVLYVMVARIAVLLVINFVTISSSTVLLAAHRRLEKAASA